MTYGTATTAINAFDKKYYQTLNAMALKYHQEMFAGVIEKIPKAVCAFNVDEYKKPVFGENKGIYGGKGGIDSVAMETEKSHIVWALKNVNAKLFYDQDDMMALGDKLIQQKNAQVMELARQATLSLFKGVYSKGYNSTGVGQGIQLNYGFIDKATTVTDLDGADSALAAAGDVYAALVKFVTSIPFRYVEGKEIILGMTPHFYDMANSTTFTNDSGVTEWEQFRRLHIGGVSPYKVSTEVIFSNDLFLDSTDTVNTNDRLFAFIKDSDTIERAYSRGFGLKAPGVQNADGGITEIYTIKEAGCVNDSNAVIYSEQISW